MTFVGHNAGVTYRVETRHTGQRLLLKIAEPVGERGGGAPEPFHSTLRWLATLARDTALVVQEPVPNRRGELLTAVPFDDLADSFSCSLQRWVNGDHVAGDFTSAHTYRIGAMLATLHRHGSRWPLAATLAAHESAGNSSLASPSSWRSDGASATRRRWQGHRDCSPESDGDLLVPHLSNGRSAIRSLAESVALPVTLKREWRAARRPKPSRVAPSPLGNAAPIPSRVAVSRPSRSDSLTRSHTGF